MALRATTTQKPSGTLATVSTNQPADHDKKTSTATTLDGLNFDYDTPPCFADPDDPDAGMLRAPKKDNSDKKEVAKEITPDEQYPLENIPANIQTITTQLTAMAEDKTCCFKLVLSKKTSSLYNYMEKIDRGLISLRLPVLIRALIYMARFLQASKETDSHDIYELFGNAIWAVSKFSQPTEERYFTMTYGEKILGFSINESNFLKTLEFKLEIMEEQLSHWKKNISNLVQLFKEKENSYIKEETIQIMDFEKKKIAFPPKKGILYGIFQTDDDYGDDAPIRSLILMQGDINEEINNLQEEIHALETDCRRIELQKNELERTLKQAEIDKKDLAPHLEERRKINLLIEKTQKSIRQLKYQLNQAESTAESLAKDMDARRHATNSL